MQEAVDCRRDGALAAARALVPLLAERAAAGDLERRFPYEQLAMVRAAGLEALPVPVGCGGLGGTMVEQIRAVGELAAGDPNVAQIYLVHCNVAELVAAAAAPRVRDELLARSAAGELRWTNAFTDARDSSTTLERSGDGWLLSARKFYATGSLGGDWLATFARGGAGGPRAVLVPCDAPGVTVVDDWSSMGQATTASGSVVFDRVAIPDDHVFAPPPNDPDDVFLIHGPLGTSAILLGCVRAAFDEMVAYAREHARPSPAAGVSRVAEDPYVLHRIGELRTVVDAIDVLQEQALDALGAAIAAPSAEARARASIATSQVRAAATSWGLRVCAELFQVCGASATRRRWDFDRHWRNLRTLSLNEPIDYRLRLVGDYWLNGVLPPVTPFS